jgi:Kef-type K+ transport system membrane component KefB
MMSLAALFARCLPQLVVVLGTCQLLGLLASRAGQPRVLGEILGGIVLGPSLLGALLPGVQSYLFPRASLPSLNTISQLSLLLFMFLIGLEFDAAVFRSRLRAAVVVSLAGMLLPLVLGIGLAVALARDARCFPCGSPHWVPILFLGLAMSITAFPVLARLLQARSLLTTPVGTLALGAGAVSDAVAWCLLAALLAGLQHDLRKALLAAGGAIVYLALVRWLLGPLVRWLASVRDQHQLRLPLLPIVLMLVLQGAWFTDVIGLHAVFGAFLVGTAVRRTHAITAVQVPLRQLASLLLPLYFAYSGLNTHLGSLDSAALWGILGLILLVAFVGKGLACWFAARLSGQTQRDAVAIGALMNARGLVELIVLNVGLERHIITPTLFTMMVLVALVTTAMASPLVGAVYGQVRTALPSRAG